MPELPEVELVARSLDTIVSGKKIVASELLRQRLVPDCSPADFASQLSNCRINFVHRRGKHILFDLDNGQTLITHLRMSGRFLHLPLEYENPKFTHAIFYLESETKLVFDDQRHFGLMKIEDTARVHETESIKKLAPEPFSDEFSPNYLRAQLRSSKRSLKEFLIDQTKVCGLGNIYAAEVMFLAKLNPEQPANTVSATKSVILHDKVRQILDEAVSLGATLDIDETNIGGSIYGSGSDWVWRVYDREGEECVVCKLPISRIRQGGRSTYFCKRCQRKR
ncbi:MAG: bifunctional DNA-formamidopyrimidine glycosylase/DNA-(apurinic or apyrimidinic site) lyase [Pyrinomonadaceae bacterium]